MFGRNHTSDFEIWSFPELLMFMILFWCWAVNHNPQSATWSHEWTVDLPFCSNIAILFFFFLAFIQYSVNYMRYLALYCTTDFVLGDFPNSRLLLLFWAHLREVRLSSDVWQIRCIKCIFSWHYFQLVMGLSGCNPGRSWGGFVVLMVAAT